MAIDELLIIVDHVLEKPGFGWDHEDVGRDDLVA